MTVKTTRKELDLEPRTLPSGEWDTASRQHVDIDSSAAVKHTISLLKVSDIETGAPPSPLYRHECLEHASNVRITFGLFDITQSMSSVRHLVDQWG